MSYDELDSRIAHVYIPRLQHAEALVAVREMLSMPDLTPYQYDNALMTLCCVLGHFKQRQYKEEILSITSVLLERMQHPDCLYYQFRQDQAASVRIMRGMALVDLERISEAVEEYSLVLMNDPTHVLALVSRCRVYGDLLEIQLMQSDLESLKKLQSLGLTQEYEDSVQALQARWDSIETAFRSGDPTFSVFRRAYSEGVASASSKLVFYNPKWPAEFNVSRLVASLQNHHLVENIQLLRRGTESLADLGDITPAVCMIRGSVDVLVHLCFAEEDKFCFRALSESLPGKIACLPYSDSMKSVALLVALEGPMFVSRTLFEFSDDFLPDEGLVIVYHLIVDCEMCDNCLIRWVIHEGAVVFSDRRPFDEDTARRDLSMFSRLVRDAESYRKLRQSRAEQHEVCRRLHDLLLGGIERFLRNSEHVTFVPDRMLALVPFACLLDVDGKYLIERCSISVSASLRMIRVNARQKEHIVLGGSTQTSLICGNPTNDRMGSFLNEIRGVVHELSSHGVTPIVLTADSFVKDVVFESCSDLRPSILHVVSHGDPQNSVSDTERYTGVLEQFRIGGTIAASLGCIAARAVADDCDLSSTDLVFLNCCALADGRLQPLGVLGFNRACFQAGCPSVISALWGVFSLVSLRIAKAFYRFLCREECDKAEALRKAILLIMRSRTHGLSLREFPVLWASYQLFGNRA